MAFIKYQVDINLMYSSTENQINRTNLEGGKNNDKQQQYSNGSSTG